ncbi:catalase [Methylovirgula ligni]|uniref:Catalase-related peroxidase n=1 Tax=Methylovirgula ligni TaxID=569860 RepID=A0A3D9Z4P2_9HYPH|nr:catalase family peroxidase [Methylovirgula ligni]QAY95461.1 catalase [Methylovirgula ligni]REF89210.1 catalase [Methylovirgula ligni]
MFRSLLLAAGLLSSFSLLAPAEAQSLPEEIVNALNKVWGVHPGFRANHAKGIVGQGTFKATPAAAELSKAAIFSGDTIPVTIRFSDSGGLPNVPDGSPKAVPHGLSIKFHLKDGSETDIVINSLKFFPVATGEDFRDLLLAVAASPPDAPKPTKLDLFFKAHPRAPAAFAALQQPDSLADEQYNGVDAFVFVDKSGKKQAFRYIAAPEKLVHISNEEAAKKQPNYLFDEIAVRVAKHPVVFHLEAQLAAPGDVTKDPTVPWPADRKVVDLGVLTIDKIDANSLEEQKKLLFLPGALISGIEESDDPLVDVRDGAYAVSFGRRSQ